MRLLIQQKLDTFYFITADYAFGVSLEADARDAIAKAGGKTIGGVRAPLNTADFSSYLLSAQASGAKVVVLANTGADLSTSLKQANEFGLTASQYIATPITYLSDVNALGLNDRAWSRLHAILVLGPQRRARAPSPSAFSSARSACQTTIRRRSIPQCCIISKRSGRSAATTRSPSPRR